MKLLKTFETWNDNIIDDSLFVSGRAKYNPNVSNGTIRYKTGNAEPYYFAEITRIGGRFICKIYKKKKDGEEIRLRNKMKRTLKTAHNYVREFLNDRLNKKNKKNKRGEEDISKKKHKNREREMPQMDFSELPMSESPPMMMPEYTPPRHKTIIRRY